MNDLTFEEHLEIWTAGYAVGHAKMTVEKLAPLIDEIYQRGLDAPEAAAFIIEALQSEPDPIPTRSQESA